MSIHFDLLELQLLLEYNIAELLSQYNFSGLSISTLRIPVTKFCNHIPRFDASKHATNYVAIMKEVTKGCLKLFHEIGHPATRKMWPDMDR